MTKHEYARIAIILKANYQRFPNYVKSLEDKMVLSAQYELIKDLSYDAITTAIMAWCQREKFPPTVADIREQCYQHTTKQIGVDEAWKHFRMAVQDYNYNNEETLYRRLGEMDKTLESTARSFGIRQLAQSDKSNEMADRAHFIKLYQSSQKREQDKGVLSASVKRLIEHNFEQEYLKMGNQELEKIGRTNDNECNLAIIETREEERSDKARTSDEDGIVGQDD